LGQCPHVQRAQRVGGDDQQAGRPIPGTSGAPSRGWLSRDAQTRRADGIVLSRTMPDIRSCICVWFQQADAPDGIVCSGDMTTLSATAGIRDAGRLPGVDVYIVSKQTSPILDYVDPPMDSYVEDIAMTGELLGNTLLQELSNSDSNESLRQELFFRLIITYPNNDSLFSGKHNDRQNPGLRQVHQQCKTSVTKIHSGRTSFRQCVQINLFSCGRGSQPSCKRSRGSAGIILCIDSEECYGARATEESLALST